MKNLCFTLTIFCLSSIGVSQTYVPFPTGEAVWTYKELSSPNFYRYDSYKQEKDTLINNFTYNKIIHITPYSTKYTGAIREDDKKVYVVHADSTQELLLYDFNLAVGDTFFTTWARHYQDTLIVSQIKNWENLI